MFITGNIKTRDAHGLNSIIPLCSFSHDSQNRCGSVWLDNFMKVSSSSRVVQNRSLWWHNGRALGLLSPRRKETVMKIFSCLDYQNIVCAAQLITSSRMKWFIFHQTNFYVSLRNSFFCYFCSLHRAILRKHQLIASHTDARHAFLCFNR